MRVDYRAASRCFITTAHWRIVLLGQTAVTSSIKQKSNLIHDEVISDEQRNKHSSTETHSCKNRNRSSSIAEAAGAV